jgi:hypothetical protein
MDFVAPARMPHKKPMLQKSPVNGVTRGNSQGSTQELPVRAPFAELAGLARAISDDPQALAGSLGGWPRSADGQPVHEHQFPDAGFQQLP